MLLQLLISQTVFLKVLQAIDRNEKVGLCLPGINVTSGIYIHENEGVWFPQYRTSQPENKNFKCHTLYEKMNYGEGKTFSIDVDAYYTWKNVVLKESYIQSYEQEQRGLLVDEEFFPGEGPYKIKNFIIKLTPQYRVRYVCTDFRKARHDEIVVYIETRNLKTNMNIIGKALADIKNAGIRVTLDKIEQNGCSRPISDKGYPEEEENE